MRTALPAGWVVVIRGIYIRIILINNNMIDGINTICSVQNRNSGNNAGSNSSKS